MVTKAVLDHLLISQSTSDSNNVDITPVWKNSASRQYTWYGVNKKLIGRFYNAFLDGKIFINPTISIDSFGYNTITGMVNIGSGPDENDLKMLGY